MEFILFCAIVLIVVIYTEGKKADESTEKGDSSLSDNTSRITYVSAAPKKGRPKSKSKPSTTSLMFNPPHREVQKKNNSIAIRPAIEKRVSSYSYDDAFDEYDYREKHKPVRIERTLTHCVIYEVSQRTRAWHEIREGRITGTSAHYLASRSVAESITKAELRNESFFCNDAMRRGQELEPIGLAKFSEDSGLKISSAGFIVSRNHEAAGYSPDGLILGRDGEIKAVVEHKAFNSQRHFDCFNKVPMSINFQIQFGMFVTGAKYAYLVFYNPDLYRKDQQLKWKKIDRDPKIQDLFEERFCDFERGCRILTSKSSIYNSRRGNGRAVYCCRDDLSIVREYKSVSQAARAMGVDNSCIRDAATGKQIHSAGYKWIYKDEYLANN